MYADFAKFSRVMYTFRERAENYEFPGEDREALMREE
jgi:hypothetical protein